MDNSLIKINEIFSETVFAKYKRKRYGMKTCYAVIDQDLADDLKNLYTRLLEMTECNCITPGMCTLDKVKERINTL